jgi:glycosyltransferase involved in cell wall biosynthesis
MKVSNHPKVAIITRTKDRGILLERAILSVHKQTMGDFIHMIVNDGGKRETVDNLLKKHQKLIKGRVKVIHNTKSQGRGSASNQGIRATNSVYIAIHDDDDTWHPDFLKKTTNYLDKTKCMGVWVATDVVVERIDGKSVKQLSKTRWLPQFGDVLLYTLCLDNYLISFLYNRDVFKTIGYYDESLSTCEDWDFNLRFVEHFDVDFIDSPHALAYYHHRPAQKGIYGNSVLAGEDQHNHNRTMLANRYLREEMKNGKLGKGYFMNSLTLQRENRMALEMQIADLRSQIAQINVTVDDIFTKMPEHILAHIDQTIYQRTSVVHILGRMVKIIKRSPKVSIKEKE